MKAAQQIAPAAMTVDPPASPERQLFEVALQQVCEALPIPCAVFDAADDSVILANRAFLGEFGGRPVSRTTFEQGFEPVAVLNTQGDSRRLAGESQGASPLEVFCPSTGRSYAFQWSSMRSPDGSPLAVLSTQDLTERMEALRQHRALQEQLLSSSRAMSVGEMATTLAHEINQPLAAILNCLTAARALLAQGMTQAQRLRQALDLAFEQAEQAVAVVVRIREFVRTREPRREPLDVPELIDHVVQLQQLDAQKHRVHVSIERERGLPRVLADRVMLEQVLTNLVRNGIEAMRTPRPGARALTICARRDVEGRVEVRVADQGPGVSPADEHQLFTPFFTTKPDGMGIGLAICRSIIEFHQGHLYFERNPAGGSIFAFTLPQASE